MAADARLGARWRAAIRDQSSTPPRLHAGRPGTALRPGRAVVGATDTSTLSETVASIFERDVDAYVVNPKHETVFGQKTYPSLTDIGRPVDAVFSLLSAAGTVTLAEEVADTGSGGLIVVASGFAEVGGEGPELQERLQRAAAPGQLPRGRAERRRLPRRQPRHTS